jgi:hypothetical protein
MSQHQSSQLASKEGRILLAIQAFHKGQFKSLRAATKVYRVSYSTASDRLHGRATKTKLRSVYYKLTETEESSLINWILLMDECGLAPRVNTIRQMANLLLKRRDKRSLTLMAIDQDLIVS